MTRERIGIATFLAMAGLAIAVASWGAAVEWTHTRDCLPVQARSHHGR